MKLSEDSYCETSAPKANRHNSDFSLICKIEITRQKNYCVKDFSKSEMYSKGGFPVIAEITRKLAANTRRQFFFFIITTESTCCLQLVESFQVICYS